MAATLSDGMSNIAVRSFGSYNIKWNGSTWDRVRTANLHKFFNAQAVGTAFSFWAAPGTTKTIRIIQMTLSFSAAVSFQLVKNDGTTVIWQGPKVLVDTPITIFIPGGVVHPTANEAMKILSSGAANLTGTISGCEDDSSV